MRDLPPTLGSGRRRAAAGRCGGRRPRGDRRPRALGHSGPRRLPHARVLRRRPRQRVLAARGRCLVRGAPRRRRRHPLDRPGDPRGGRGGAHGDHRAPPVVDARPRHDDVRGQVGLRPRPRHGARAAARGPRRGRHPDVARRAHGAARVRRRRCVRRLPARGGAARGGAARGGRRRLPRARLVRRPTSPAATSRRAATRGSRFVCTATSSRSRARSGSRSSSGRDRSTTSRRPGPAGVAQLAASDVAGVLLPASALFLGRPMPPGASARRRRRACRARDRLQPGQRLLRQPAARPLASPAPS